MHRLISIIIPTYNSAQTIGHCLQSIALQMPADGEIIVVEDGSTDATEAALSAFADLRGLRVLRNDKQSGASASRNRGLAAAQGAWVMFVDADDELPPETLPAMLARATDTTTDLVVGAHFKRMPNGSCLLNRHGLESSSHLRTDELGPYVERYACEPYLHTLLVHCWGKLFRRSVITENQLTFDEQLEQLEDVNFNFKFLRCSSSLSYFDYPCYIHVIWQGNSMSARSGTEADPVSRIHTAYRPIAEFLTDKCGYSTARAQRLTRRLLFTTAIIWLLRIRKKFAGIGIKQLAQTIRPIIRAPLLRESTSAYELMPKDSRIVYLGVLLGAPFMCAIALKIDNLIRTGEGK